MKYSLTEDALRKLICCFKDKFNNHKHSIMDVNGLSDLLNGGGGNTIGGLSVSWDDYGNVTLIGGGITATYDNNGNVTFM